MKYKIVAVRNVARLLAAADALSSRAQGMPGMGAIHGPTGAGKSTAVAYYSQLVNGVYVRAMALWSPAAMLDSILLELDIRAGGSNAAKVSAIVQALARTGRPLIIDEADYLVDSKRLTETVRDLHDLSTVPVILVGMADLLRKLASREQLLGRMAQRVRFEPCDVADARKLAAELAEVGVEDDLLGRLHADTGGSVRLLVVGLAHVEAAARRKGLKSIGLKDWGHRKFDTGEDPAPAGRPNVTSLRGASE